MRLQTFAILCLSLATMTSHAAKPNVLFIAIDDLRNFVGCFGYNQVKTPNIDRLGKNSVIFRNAHNQAPMCGPSRASCMTGIAPYNSGAYGFVDWQKVPKLMQATTLPRHFKDNGYHVMGGGKIFHHYVPKDDFDEYYCKAQHKGATWGSWKDEERIPAKNKVMKGGILAGPMDVPDEHFHDTLTANMAVERLRQKYDKPFFLGVGFTKPHTPWIVPRKYFDMYDPDHLEMPQVKEDDLNDIPDAARFLQNYTEDHLIREQHAQRKLLHAYLATITYVDTQIGKVLTALEQSPYADNTIVVLWSDHGWSLGEKHHWHKFTLWQECTRNPLMISVPGLTRGQSCNRPVQLLDIYPTLVDLCGFPAPKSQLDGHSLVPLLKNPNAPWQWPAITCNGRDSFALTFDRWKYTHFFDGSEELYDHENDPLEHNNLATNPEYAKVKTDCAKHIPPSTHTNVDFGHSWICWRWDHPPMKEWREEYDAFQKSVAAGKPDYNIRYRKVRTVAGTAGNRGNGKKKRKHDK